MKVCIICFDALEYTIVHRGEYPCLKQREYGRVHINVYPLSTPVIWASFITGEKPPKHGVFANTKWSEQLSELLKKLSIKLGLHTIILKEKEKILNTIRLGPWNVCKNFKTPNIFDYVDKSIAVSIPAYNEWNDNIELRKRISSTIGKPHEEKKLAEDAWKVFRAGKEKALKLLEGDWELFMVHLYIADIIQHIWYYKEDKIAELYERLDKTAEEIASKLPEETLLLIVSDHGLLKGYHTPYGFYSCNMRLNLENLKITDFADIIREKLGVPKREEIQKIKERLKALGY